MDHLSTLFTTVVHLPAVAVVFSLLIFSLLLGRLYLFSLRIRVYYGSLQRSHTRPVISGLKLILAYLGSLPFVFESCGTVIWAFILFKFASSVTHVLSWLPLLLVVGHIGNHALRNLGGPVRALLKGHCRRLAQDYRWDRFLVDMLVPSPEHRNTFTRIVLYFADRVHASFTAGRWQDALVGEFQRRQIFGPGPYTYRLLERMCHSGNYIGTDWQRPDWAEDN
ncbi:hypothetical protein F5Y05DRAFT_410240 [Hypoxylon sp. FL0543]|nr:hypothetical protein F5Y05DRAFT_410240 [Hypoxylon sp. FL0543]